MNLPNMPNQVVEICLSADGRRTVSVAVAAELKKVELPKLVKIDDTFSKADVMFERLTAKSANQSVFYGGFIVIIDSQLKPVLSLVSLGTLL